MKNTTKSKVTSDAGLRRLGRKRGYAVDWNSFSGEYVIERVAPFARVFSGSLSACGAWLSSATDSPCGR